MYTASSFPGSLPFLERMFISLTLKILRPSYNADSKRTAIHEPTNTEREKSDKRARDIFPSFLDSKSRFFLELSNNKFISKSNRLGLLKINRGFENISLLCCLILRGLLCVRALVSFILSVKHKWPYLTSFEFVSGVG